MWGQLVERVMPLAKDPNLLRRVVAAIHRLGVVREDTAIKATYLTVTSRLLRRAGHLSAAPRNSGRRQDYLSTSPRSPSAESVIRISGSSPKVLAYFGDDDPDFLAFKVVYIPKATALLVKGGEENELARC